MRSARRSRATRTISDLTLPLSTRQEAPLSRVRREPRQALPGALEQLLFDLHRGHEGFPHGLDRHEFDDMQQLDFGAERRGGALCLCARFANTAFGQVNDQQDATVNVMTSPHARRRCRKEQSPSQNCLSSRQRAASARSQGNGLGVS